MQMTPQTRRLADRPGPPPLSYPVQAAAAEGGASAVVYLTVMKWLGFGQPPAA